MASKPKELKEFGAWSEQTSSSGRKYFYNKDTEISQWEKPKDWRDHEIKLEQERIAAEQQRVQPPLPPAPPMFPFPTPPPFPFSPSIPPPPGFPGFHMNTPPPFPPPPFGGPPSQFGPPTVPPVPPPRLNTNVPPPVPPMTSSGGFNLISHPPPPPQVQPPSAHGALPSAHSGPPPPFMGSQQQKQHQGGQKMAGGQHHAGKAQTPGHFASPSQHHAHTPGRLPTYDHATKPQSSAHFASPSQHHANNKPPTPGHFASPRMNQSPRVQHQTPQRSPMQGVHHQNHQQQQQQQNRAMKPQSQMTSSSDASRDVKPHPYATPQPVQNLHPQSVQFTMSQPPPPTGRLVAKEEIKQEEKAHVNGDAGKPVKREREESDSENGVEQANAAKKVKEEPARPEEPWRRFYDAQLGAKKKAELKLEEDTELSDLVLQSLALENKLIAELIKVKQAAAMVAVQEHEVLLCQGKIANLQEQQRGIEKRSQNAPAINLPDLDDFKQQFTQR